ncbi:MAG TPA: response regulator [Cerasibacillus sp.]|uniref:response regulator n=1 Tax=Cerasibacillus sp. TaxID=2498711 RepID=UPI002F4126AA
MAKKILIVDDEAGIRLLLKEILKQDGHHICQAKTGKEALDKMTAAPFDLLIIDYHIPILDGVAVLQQLQEKGIHLPCIFMTGMFEMLVDELEEMDFVTGIIAKPFHVHELLKLVRGTLCETKS